MESRFHSIEELMKERVFELAYPLHGSRSHLAT
jgi:hypothetical protein